MLSLSSSPSPLSLSKDARFNHYGFEGGLRVFFDMSRGSCCLLRPMGTLGATERPLPVSFLVCLMEVNHNCLVRRAGNSFAVRIVAEQCSCDDVRRIDATVDQRSPTSGHAQNPRFTASALLALFFFFFFFFLFVGVMQHV